MAKLVNTQWSTHAAVALVIATALAGCGRRDDRDGPGTPGPGNPPGANNPTDTFAITSMNRLVTFNRNSPAIRNAVNITGLASGETIFGFDIRPTDGAIVALSSSARLYRLSSTDGTATLIAPLMANSTDNTDPFTALQGTSFGVNFNPVPNALRVVSNTAQNLRIDTTTGATITDGTLSTTNIAATAYTNSFPSACRTNLFYINTTTNQLMSTPNPNLGMLNVVGTIQVATGAAITGFEVLTTADSSNNNSPVNTALLVTTASGTSTLMTLNLNNAAVSNSQTITGLNSGETVTAISMAPPNTTPQQALGELVAVTQSNRLISFNRAAPQKLCTPATNITNLQAGDNVLGIDVRPRDGLLYAIGTSGRLYTISTTAGNDFARATMGPMLQPAVNSSFNGLNGNEFGFDFNPMTDRLRVVSNIGQNLSINVDDGTATAQTALNPGAPNITAVAYNNNLVNTSATTLFVIDTGNESLSTQGVPTTMPANGTLTRLGNLSIADVTGSSGFDISPRDAPDNPLAVAALTLAATPGSSDLFDINVVSGFAQRINTIGGGERIRGLAFSNAPQTMLLAVTSDNQLITFDPAAPETLVDSVGINGLQGGESVIALQVQTDGKLQITSDGQRRYTLDAISGEATLVTSVETPRPRASGVSAAGVRFNASTANGAGLNFATSVTALGQSRLFKLDANGQATAMGMIGPSGTATVRALAIRLN